MDDDCIAMPWSFAATFNNSPSAGGLESESDMMMMIPISGFPWMHPENNLLNLFSTVKRNYFGLTTLGTLKLGISVDDDTDYLVYDHQSHELFIVTRYTAAGIDPEDGTLVFFEDNVDHQFPYKTLTFDVFRVDFTNDDHIELQYIDGTLGNRAFFIGSNSGFALSTTQFPELRPNSIYFTDNQTPLYRYRKTLNCGGHD
ncbi:hypothetical protein CQW23_11987 [Capsicum baccatum]|uniref:KIB1-4 beta-propeller domain-containing protein n=1 Tax=Capsicum baccatum TaxID=33114 RepID=A0A2G2WRG8_CAPBA|nr:hypothetical protein CQW23_11987 [Capsicum baccatum]